MSRRTEMLGSTIRQELSMIIMRELADPRIRHFPAITRVKVADDLSTADVYVTMMGTPGEQTAALNALKHAAGMMRQKLGKSLSIRTTPYLRFQIDEGLKKEVEMLELLHKIDQERAADEAARGLGADSAAEPVEPDEDPQK